MYKAKHGFILESKYLIWSLILESKNVEKRREGEKRKREEEEEEEEKRREEERRKDQKEQSYGISIVLGMETKIFVWIVMGWCEFVDFYMKFLLELGFEVLKSVITC